MSKFKTEDKIQIVLRYLKGNESLEKIAEEVRVSHSIISGWVRLYEQHGIEAFIKSYTNYSWEFKLNVLNYMNETGTSSYDAAAIFNISSPRLIRNWRSKFEQGGIGALEEKKKGRPLMKKKPKKIDSKKSIPAEGSVEALQERIARLEMENTYLKKLRAFRKNPNAFLEKHKLNWHLNSKKKDTD